MKSKFDYFINGRCIDKIFNNLVKRNKNLKELKVARFLPMMGFSIELILELIGIFLVYYVINWLAPYIAGDNFNNNFLYSMVFIPIVNVLKHSPDIVKSVFVRIAICDEYIVCKRGYFRKFIDKLYVKHIDNVEIRTTLWGEWFNYGAIKLYSFGGNINLPFIKNPNKVYAFIKRKMKNREGF